MNNTTNGAVQYSQRDGSVHVCVAVLLTVLYDIHVGMIRPEPFTSEHVQHS